MAGLTSLQFRKTVVAKQKEKINTTHADVSPGKRAIRTPCHSRKGELFISEE